MSKKSSGTLKRIKPRDSSSDANSHYFLS